MTGVITWTFDSGDGVCIEREQPSTALKPMTHFTTYCGSHFSAGPDVYHPEFQPELNDFEIPHGPHFHGHDPVTGLDTGSGNGPIVHHVGTTAGPGGTTYFTENIGGTSGPGGTTYFTENVTGFSTENLDSRLINHDDFLMVNNVGGTSGPGGTSFFSGYSEAVGLDSSTVDVMNNVISSLQPANEFI